MWKTNPNPWEMRLMFPEEARLLEDTFLFQELYDLGIVFKKTKTKYKTTFKVKLTEEKELWISPIDVGPQGQSEWITWHKSHQHGQREEQQTEYQMSIRACIQLVDKSEGKSQVVHTFTNLQGNLEDLLRSSLFCVHRDFGYQLAPVLKGQRKPSNRQV